MYRRLGAVLALALGLATGTGSAAQAGAVHHHDRANSAIGGIGTCF
ncbi:hypothetical protein GA0070607_2759 [Micromonospora coriariae]|uniref:Uncharacterized protein n=1 Tax=Micromonospora coriariae TaxID=285665 RepID=A0A1C4VWC2_9ACTN|nr:hypothetical protein [Micromonospora coriariae]SCE88314.1 hypothetical protein GA0070607_2759 [Micromonospora coriariae]